MTGKVDITPRGTQTPEGIARIIAATQRLEKANAACADALEGLLNDTSSPRRWGPASTAIAERKAAIEEFLRALAGAPAAEVRS